VISFYNLSSTSKEENYLLWLVAPKYILTYAQLEDRRSTTKVVPSSFAAAAEREEVFADGIKKLTFTQPTSSEFLLCIISFLFWFKENG
jgi:hypothetical protein